MKRTIFGALLASGLAVMSLSAQAVPIDFDNLLLAGGTETIGTAVYTQVPAQPTGSGVIDSFVRIRDNQDIVQGYNTTVNNVYQNDSSNTFNHQVTVGQIGLIDSNGGAAGGEVMRFLLDINQTGDNPLLSLDEIQIFLSTIPNQSISPALAQGQLLTLGTLVYQLDAGADNRVLLDYSLNSGSGSGDMTLDIPLALLNSAFAAGGFNTIAAQNEAFLYLYSRFGSAPNGNNDGFEEWAHFEGNPIGEPPCVVDCGPIIIPEPGGFALLGIGLLGAAVAARRRHKV